jgi:hypothetical protein
MKIMKIMEASLQRNEPVVGQVTVEEICRTLFHIPDVADPQVLSFYRTSLGDQKTGQCRSNLLSNLPKSPPTSQSLSLA